MKNKYTNKFLVFVIILLFVFTCFIPSLYASYQKRDTSDTTIWVFGLMKPLNTENNKTKVFVIFALFKSEGSPGGVLKLFHYYYFWDIIDFSNKFWVFCWCSNISES
jgi:hypothetical protein